MPQITEKLLEAEEKKLRVLKAEIEASRHLDAAKDSSKVSIDDTIAEPLFNVVLLLLRPKSCNSKKLTTCVCNVSACNVTMTVSFMNT